MGIRKAAPDQGEGTERARFIGETVGAIREKNSFLSEGLEGEKVRDNLPDLLPSHQQK
jgi:hypothetical protein